MCAHASPRAGRVEAAEGLGSLRLENPLVRTLAWVIVGLGCGCSLINPTAEFADSVDGGSERDDAGFDGGADAGGDAGSEDSAVPDAGMDAGIPSQCPVALAVGYNHGCMIAEDRSLWCWGSNEFGQLGLGGRENRLTPVQVGPHRDWDQIALGGRHTCGLLSGSLYCWGRNEEGQLGLGDLEERDLPSAVGVASDWMSVSLGRDHTCAIRAGGSLWCWGTNSSGVLGVGAPEPLA